MESGLLMLRHREQANINKNRTVNNILAVKRKTPFFRSINANDRVYAS